MKRIYRSLTDAKIAGVCGGIGEAIDIDPTLIRLGVIILALITGIMPVIIGYAIAALIIPEEPFGHERDESCE